MYVSTCLFINLKRQPTGTPDQFQDGCTEKLEMPPSKDTGHWNDAFVSKIQ